MTATVLCVFGTRPEAIKMAPVVQALARHAPALRAAVCVTAQHRHMLDQMLELFGLRPDEDLDLMRPGQDLLDLTVAVLRGVADVLRRTRPDLLVVQGDTTTTFAASLAAFHARVPVAHVEAGLRSHDLLAPWPEELNRRLTGAIAALHFAPTAGARDNLLREGVAPERVTVTGNTVVDALRFMVRRIDDDAELRRSLERRTAFGDPARRLVLVTAHRRESFGAGMERICAALREIVSCHPDVEVVYPVHLNPQVREPVERLLGPVGSAAGRRLHLIEPLEYLAFVHLLRRATLLITDSGGVQEEATALGKPVLVMRAVTERPEAITAGAAQLVGTDPERIAGEAARLLANHRATAPSDVFGDGRAGERIAEIIRGAVAP